MLSEALMWMATAIQEFGLKQLDVKQLIEWMKADVNSTSAPVRAAAIALLGTAHRQLGPGLDPLLSQSVKPALMQTLRDTFKANPVEQVAPHITMPSPCACHPHRQQRTDFICRHHTLWASEGAAWVQVVPTRTVRGRAGPASQAALGTTKSRAAGSTSATAPIASADADDLLPRTDISASITGRLAEAFSRYSNPYKDDLSLQRFCIYVFVVDGQG